MSTDGRIAAAKQAAVDCLWGAVSLRQAATDERFADGIYLKFIELLQRIRRAGVVFDVKLLVPELRRMDTPAEVVEAGFLARLLREGQPAHVRYYARIIKDAALRRRIEQYGEQAIAASSNGQATGDILALLQTKLDELNSEGNAGPPPRPLPKIVADYPRLRGTVIDGLLRQGETANVIAAPKAGKSWLAYGLALSVVSGREWLETFACTPGRVLIIDAELHCETIAHRLPKVAKAMDRIQL